MTTSSPPGTPPGSTDPTAGGLDRRQENRDGEGTTPEAPQPVRVEALPPAVPIEPPKPGKKLKGDRFTSKLSKKQKKALKDAHRPLDSWERYRALTDVLDEAIDLVDLADHKARFAIVIMATINVGMFWVAGSFDLTKAVPGFLRPFLGLYLLIYVLLALYFFLQAIESLRPRKSQPHVGSVAQTGIEEFPLGIRFYEDILRRDVEDYKRAWKDVHIGQLNAELAIQSHALAGINRAKYDALRRLYSGLKLMTLLAVGLVATAALSTLIGTAREVSRASQRGAKILGTAERIDPAGVKEPSGIAFHAPTGHLFVVGDEGGLANLDGTGKVVSSTKIEAQIEDVTVHTPTGQLVFLSESRSELILYDPISRQERKRWPLDLDAALGTSVTDRNQGFEGVVFRPQEGREGGGVFYVTHQRSPAMVIALEFDPAAAPRRLGAEAVISRWSLSYEDLTAIAWSEPLGRLLVLADAKDRLLVIRPDDGAVELEVPIPGRQQEGLAVDAQGGLWIADDLDKSIWHITDAINRLKVSLQRGAEEATPVVEPSAGAGMNGMTGKGLFTQ